jgi:Mg2+-importing ATPase
VCQDLDIKIKGIVLGSEIAHLGHEELCRVVENANIFARVTPSQKEHIIEALRHNKHVVGFIGDGINDTPPMKVADVSISVENAVDAAKETADIILLEKDLRVLADGVLEGRVTFGNNEKYMNYSISSNFGTMFSAALGSLFVPFLPMLPVQVLLNNLLNDVAQITLPGDSVDPEYLMRPKKISIPLTLRFMVCFGPMSSLFDIVMFIAMLFLFQPVNLDGSLNLLSVRLFQKAFVVETLTCQLIIIFVILTRHVPFWKSKPKMILVTSVFAILALTLLLPYLPIGAWFDFTPLPPVVFLVLAICWACYIAIVEAMKHWFYRKFANIS